jgi:transcriptional regulator with XRE-family HTH domain
MAALMGLSLPAYKRFERGRITRPRLAHFVNASITLDVPLELLIDDDYLSRRSLSDKKLTSPPWDANAEIRVTSEWEQRRPPEYPEV